MNKVLYVLQDSRFSGNANQFGGKIAHVVGVVEELKRLGKDTLIACFERVPSLNVPDSDYLFFSKRPFRSPIVGPILKQWQIITQLNEWIHEHSPELLYVRWMQNVYFQRVRRRFPNLRIIVECNTPLEMGLAEAEASRYKKWMALRADQSLVQSASVISAVSGDVKDYLIDHHPSLAPGHVVVNPNGVDARRFSPNKGDIRNEVGADTDAILIGFAGNFRVWHRIDILIKAFQELDAEGVNLLIMGTGPKELEAKLRSIAENNGSQRIRFTGPIPYDRMPEYLSSCDILVAPHGKFSGDKFHGSPVKLFEYMATGRAVVASRIGQLAEVIEDGRNGLLFEPESTVELKAALQKLIADRTLRERLGKTARRDTEEKYSWAANVERILRAAESL